jgi:hypothetical protein
MSEKGDGIGVSEKGDGSGIILGEKEDVEGLLSRLNLHGDETDDFVREDEAEEKEIASKWLAIARVHTLKLAEKIQGPVRSCHCEDQNMASL